MVLIMPEFSGDWDTFMVRLRDKATVKIKREAIMPQFTNV
jgi:hypothetical protein